MPKQSKNANQNARVTKKKKPKISKQKEEIINAIMRERRLIQKRTSRATSKDVKIMKGLGLERVADVRVRKKDLEQINLRDLRKLKHNLENTHTNTVMFTNKYGVPISLEQAKTYKKALDKYNEEVMKPIYQKFRPLIAKKHSLDVDSVGVDSLEEMNDIRERVNRLKTVRSAEELAKETEKHIENLEEGENALFERYLDNYKKALLNNLPDVDAETMSEIFYALDNMGASRFNELYFSESGIFDISYVYARDNQEKRAQIILEKLQIFS